MLRSLVGSEMDIRDSPAPAARDLPGTEGTSRLSPHLHWGDISPRRIWHVVGGDAGGGGRAGDAFLRELAWRDFACHLLYHLSLIPS